MKYIKFLSWWVAIPLISCIPLLIILTPSRTFSDPLWELVPTPHTSAKMIRTPVPHGWIIAYSDLARGLVYVPDEKHEWKIK